MSFVKYMGMPMFEKISKVTNPLTVIAAFSTLTEVMGIYVFPKVPDTQLDKFVLFLIIFPIVLVVSFFLTLNFNHTVLYAPSDYRSDRGFQESRTRITGNKYASSEYDVVIANGIPLASITHEEEGLNK